MPLVPVAGVVAERASDDELAPLNVKMTVPSTPATGRAIVWTSLVPSGEVPPSSEVTDAVAPPAVVKAMALTF